MNSPKVKLKKKIRMTTMAVNDESRLNNRFSIRYDGVIL